jgi:hypothetical protein
MVVSKLLKKFALLGLFSFCLHYECFGMKDISQNQRRRFCQVESETLRQLLIESHGSINLLNREKTLLEADLEIERTKVAIY